jgi:hypothetical protein
MRDDFNECGMFDLFKFFIIEGSKGNLSIVRDDNVKHHERKLGSAKWTEVEDTYKRKLGTTEWTKA